MDVPLTPELERLVREKVSSGGYGSIGEVIREALRLLQDRDDLQPMRYDALKRDIDAGLAAAERGETISGEEALARLRERNSEAAARGGRSDTHSACPLLPGGTGREETRGRI